jgi:hypothetical protein
MLKIFSKYLLKFLKPDNYISAIKRINKKMEIVKLSGKRFHAADIHQVWKTNASSENINNISGPYNKFYIFSKVIHLDNIDWHKDISSGYIYPALRIDKLKTARLYNHGIDFLCTWVQSRFHFAINLAQMFLSTCNENYYLQFRKLIIDWINKNPFLTGINWFVPMEAAIRAINWIIATNLFGKIFDDDKELKRILSISLQQHAKYISTFPEVYKNGRTTNHTASDYAGLLFIALTLKDLPESNKWLQQSINGLVDCMDNQVYEDGSDYEGSIPYHRLVLELFAYSAIICSSNNILLPVRYYSKLFRMFEFTAAYIDESGNAPCVGDDDSGRILVFNKPEECSLYIHNDNHSYLIELGEHIFDYRFLSNALTSSNGLNRYLPVTKKISPSELGIQPRDTSTSIAFSNGGAYFLKNNRFNFMLACIPAGQNGHGGHNHFDQGSFTLSADGAQIVIDAGTGFYTPDKTKRDLLRSYHYHNTLYTSNDKAYKLDDIGIWEFKELYHSDISRYSGNEIEVTIKTINDHLLRKRHFEIEENQLLINDSYEGPFFSRLNFHPDIEIISSGKSGLITNKCEILIEGAESFIIEEFEYSPHYHKIAKSKYLNIQARNNIEIIIKV